MRGRYDWWRIGGYGLAIVFCAACFAGGYFAVKALLT